MSSTKTQEQQNGMVVESIGIIGKSHRPCMVHAFPNASSFQKRLNSSFDMSSSQCLPTLLPKKRLQDRLLGPHNIQPAILRPRQLPRPLLVPPPGQLPTSRRHAQFPAGQDIVLRGVEAMQHLIR